MKPAKRLAIPKTGERVAEILRRNACAFQSGDIE
jgi:hypothetical protein